MSNNRYEFTNISKDIFRPKFLYITKASAGDDWHSTPHVHPFMEIMFVTGGKGQLLVGTHSCDVKKGDLGILRQNFVHTEKSSKNEPLEYTILGVQDVTFDIMRDELEDEAFFPVFPFMNHYTKTMYYLDEIFKEITDKGVNYEMMIQGLIANFLVFVMRHTNLALDHDTINLSLSKECAFVKQYIDTHFKENITLDTLTEFCFISKFHLVHIFKKSLGISPIQYLIDRRIHEAKSLLETTTLPITDISQCSGFPSHNHFAEKFKIITGLSPSDYRKSFNKIMPE